MGVMNKPTYRSWRWTILSLAFLIGVVWLSWPREAPSVAVTPDITNDVAREEGVPLGGTPSIRPLPESNTREEARPAISDAPREDAPTESAEGEAEDSKFEYFTATIEGRVVDSTGALISGAMLQGIDSIFDRFPSMRETDDGMPRLPPPDHGAPEEWGTTDETGFYRIEFSLQVDRGITELDITLFATLADWSAGSEERNFSPLRAGETVTHDFVINLPGGIEGRVVDAQGVPLEGIKVAIRGLRTNNIRRTKADGRFVATKLESGTYEVSVASDIWRITKSPGPLTVKPGEVLTLAEDIQLQRVTTIRITLTCDQYLPPWASDRDKPLMAVVWLFTKDEQEVKHSAIVDSDGIVTITDLPDEVVTDVRVEVPGFVATGWFALFLREGEVNEVSFALTK